MKQNEKGMFILRFDNDYIEQCY